MWYVIIVVNNNHHRDQISSITKPDRGDSCCSDLKHGIANQSHSSVLHYSLYNIIKYPKF